MKHNTAVILAMALTLLTGLVLGQLGSLGPPRPAAIADSEPHTTQTAEQFYAAINALLVSGDPSSLRAMLHPDFIEHPATGEGSRNANELESHLQALRAALPDFRVAASSMASGSDLVASTLDAAGSAQGEASGIPIEAQIADPDFELLRVADGMVVERWSGTTFPELPEIALLASVKVDRLPIERAIVLERFTFDASATRVLGDNKGTVVIVESGSIEIHLNTSRMDALAGTPPVPEDGELLTAGTIRLIPTGVPFQLKAPRAQTASVLQLRTDALRPGESGRPPEIQQEVAPGVTREVLTYGAPLFSGSGPFTLSMHKVTLGSQTSASNHKVAATEIVWVMEGNVLIDVNGRELRQLKEGAMQILQPGRLKLTSDQGITAYPGAKVRYSAAGSSRATFLVITLALTGMNR